MSLCLAQSGHSNKQNINSLGNNKQATGTLTAKNKLNKTIKSLLSMQEGGQRCHHTDAAHECED